MSFFDALFGRHRPVPSKTEGLFAISTAQITLQVSLHLQPANQAAICFKSVGSRASARCAIPWLPCCRCVPRTHPRRCAASRMSTASSGLSWPPRASRTR